MEQKDNFDIVCTEDQADVVTDELLSLVPKVTEFQNAISKIDENHPPKCKDDLILEGVSEGNHKLTGSEYNQRLQIIQAYLSQVQAFEEKTVSELKEIYEVFDRLDKSYIDAIVGTLNTVADVRDREKEDRKSIEALASSVNEKLENQTKSIQEIKSSFCLAIETAKTTLSSQVDAVNNSYGAALSELDTHQTERYTDVVGRIENEKSVLSNMIASLKLKVKIAYWVAGSALAVALGSLILNICGVL